MTEFLHDFYTKPTVKGGYNGTFYTIFTRNAL